jgi:hypothetical protein
MTPRSVSVYSQGSIQASLLEVQARTSANNHTSLSGEGTWSASRAQLWARLPTPGPPTPSKAPKANANSRRSERGPGSLNEGDWVGE